ncbi:MAG: hypothetical protein KAV87_58365 [Desulfobacteraceae bacterium]|nr:hypothetical protein [Desulfobacteraceae bacterium]
MRIEVLQGDATRIQSDVLVLKYAQARFGLDSYVSGKLLEAGHKQKEMSPRPGEFRILHGAPSVSSRQVLFVGVEPLWQFRYRQIRSFGRKTLFALAGELPDTRHIIVTMHGAGYGLDEVEAFESQIAGFLDGISRGNSPDHLERITFVERNRGRAKRLAAVLEQILPQGDIAEGESPTRSRPEATERLRAAGYASTEKKHVFVAMPFTDDMEDVYDYGIQQAVRDAGFLCERADLSAFTGDVLDWIKRRIRTASLVVADLTGSNPNVYLEVGFAWGCGIPTILLVQDTDGLKFDVRGQRCLIYKRIKDLEKKLKEELSELLRSI